MGNRSGIRCEGYYKPSYEIVRRVARVLGSRCLLFELYIGTFYDSTVWHKGDVEFKMSPWLRKPK